VVLFLPTPSAFDKMSVDELETKAHQKRHLQEPTESAAKRYREGLKEALAKLNLDEMLQVAIDAATGAGKIISDAWEKREKAGGVNQFIVKDGGKDLVTVTDKASEDFVTNALRAKFPDHIIVGEENEESHTSFTDAPTWVIDPLDGTTNFVHGYPLVCVSIGFMVMQKPVLGVIYNPILKQMTAAAKGKGASCNGHSINVSKTSTIGDCIAVNNIGASRSQKFIDRTVKRISLFLNAHPRAFRSSGSACQNMVDVARGVLDCYFEDGYGGPWDVVAGCAIIEEAGGGYIHINGDQFTVRFGKGTIICGNFALIKEIAKLFNTAES